MERLSISLRGEVTEESIVALASRTLDNKSSNSLFCSFEIAKISKTEHNNYTVRYYRHKLGTKEFEIISPIEEFIVNNSELRCIIKDQEITTDSKVLTLDNFCIENVVKCCFNGI